MPSFWTGVADRGRGALQQLDIALGTVLQAPRRKRVQPE